MFENILGKKIGETYIANVVLCIDGIYEEFSFEANKGKELITIEALREGFGDFDHVIKIYFIEKEIKTYRGKIIESIKSKKNYFMGVKMSLSQFSSFTDKDNDVYNKIIIHDDYQTGAVVHPTSGLVSTLAAKDEILEFKPKVKTIKR